MRPTHPDRAGSSRLGLAGEGQPFPGLGLIPIKFNLTHQRMESEGLMKLTSNSFKGHWKIVWTEMGDQDFVDEEVPGHAHLVIRALEISNLAMCTARLPGQRRMAA
jgi:hypothetical protein